MIIVAGIIFVSVIFFYYPQSFYKTIQDGSKLFITRTKFSLNNGKSALESDTYTVLDHTNEYEEIMNIMKNHTYHRTFHSFFPKNGVEGMGENLIVIYVAKENDEFVNTIHISDTGDVLIDDYLYKIGGSTSDFIQEILSFLEENASGNSGSN